MNISMEEKILNAYTEGLPIVLIAQGFLIEPEEVLEHLIAFKDKNRSKRRAFTDAFKMAIADRDLNGVARSDIAKELNVNINTVKKSCEEFGQSFKERAMTERLFTRMEGDFSREKCVECESSHYNEVEENTYYCMSCGKEFIYEESAVLHVNWEYFD